MHRDVKLGSGVLPKDKKNSQIYNSEAAKDFTWTHALQHYTSNKSKQNWNVKFSAHLYTLKKED